MYRRGLLINACAFCLGLVLVGLFASVWHADLIGLGLSCICIGASMVGMLLSVNMPNGEDDRASV